MGFSKHFQQVRTVVFILAFSLLFGVAVAGQGSVVVGKDFERAHVVPALFRDTSGRLAFEDVIRPEFRQQFVPAKTPFFALGSDPSNLWLTFRVENTLPVRKTLIFTINRKNFDAFEFWQCDFKGQSVHFEKVGVKAKSNPQFWLNDGYYYPVTLLPGQSYEFFCMSYNRVGAMHLGLEFYSPEAFAIESRLDVLAFGLFLGVMLISLLFTGMLVFQYREGIYIAFFVYVLNILLREAHEFAADFDLLPLLQRHAISVFLGMSFSFFYRYFMKLWELSPLIDRLTKWYAWLTGGFALAIIYLTNVDNPAVLNWVFKIVNTLNLFFSLLALGVAIYFWKKSVRAKVTLLAYLPLAFAFVTILLRNLNVIGNYPFIQHAMMWGFIFEVLILTTVFAVWYRTIETDRSFLQMKLNQEFLEKKLAVQSAEQRVKDKIARDLHDDLAASLSGIRILSKVAQDQFGSKLPESAPILHHINTSATAAVENLGDLIWTVKPGGDFLNNMADRIREHAAKLLDAKEIDYHFDIPRELPEMDFDLETKRNLFLIFKEALNNALKYSQAKFIAIALNVKENILEMKISDNGIGFDTETVRPGNGIKNMKDRASQIGATFEIRTQPDDGTIIELRKNLQAN